MILDRLELRNFKRFRHAEIHFRDGITGILGNNGAGKSSLVSAILFALYGVKATGISADYIVSSFAGPKDKCEIILDFCIGGDTYKIIRTFRKGKTVSHDAEMYKNSKLLAKEVSPVEEAVKRSLGMGPVDFKNTIYAAQKDLLTLLENTPGKRKEWFLRALGIEYLNTGSQKVLKDQIDAKNGELQKKEGELSALSGRQNAEEFARLTASVGTFSAAITRHQNQKTALSREREELDTKAKILDAQKTAAARLEQQQHAVRQELAIDTAQAAKLEGALALLKDEEAEYHRLEMTAATYPEVRARLDDLTKKKAEHARLAGEIGFIRREIADLATRAEKKRAEIGGLDTDTAEHARICSEVRRSIGAPDGTPDDRLDGMVRYRQNEIMKRIGTISAQLRQYDDERRKILSDQETIRSAGADGICPLCRQKLGEHFGSLDQEFTTKLAELEDRAVADLEKQERLQHEQNDIARLIPLLDSLRTIAGRLKFRAGYEIELADLQKKHATKVLEEKGFAESIARLAYDDAAFNACEGDAAAVQKAQARFTELGKKIGSAAATRQQLADLTARIAARNTELERIRPEIAKNAFDPKTAAELDAARARSDAGLRACEVAIANAERDRKFAEEKIAEYRKAEAQIAGIGRQVREIRDEIELLKLTRSLIADYVVYLLQVVKSRIEGETSRILAEITGGRYEQVLLDDDFNLLVRDIDDDYPVDRFSGGEQDDIAVALRIALSRYLAELHQVHESTFLIFDEIFGSQDEERRANLLTALRTQESRFPQILLISHIQEIQGEFANTLIVEPGSDSASRVREAE